MGLITAAWLYTALGVEKGSCSNRPAKGIFVKSVETDIVGVMDYETIHIQLKFSPRKVLCNHCLLVVSCHDKQVLTNYDNNAGVM